MRIAIDIDVSEGSLRFPGSTTNLNVSRHFFEQGNVSVCAPDFPFVPFSFEAASTAGKILDFNADETDVR